MNKFMNAIFNKFNIDLQAKTPTMNTHPLTLSFPEELESKFQEDYFNSSIGLLRVSFLLGIAYYSFFAILDALVLQEVQIRFALIRFAFVTPVVFTIFLFSFTKNFRHWWQLGAVVATIVSGSGIVLMTFNAPQLARIFYYPGMMLILFYCYMLIRLRFIWASLAGWIIFISYVISLVLFPGLDSKTTTINLFFLASANMLGMFGGYALEYYTRRDFFFRHLLKKEQEKLIRQERFATLGKLAGKMSHELRNPLGVISNAIYYLKATQTSDTETMQEYLNIMGDETQQATKIVSNLLEYTQPTPPERKFVKISNLLESALKKSPPPDGIQVKVHIPENLPQPYLDPQHLQTILVNLMTNAYQAMPEGGRLSIQSSVVSKHDLGRGIDADHCLRISVRDTGIGYLPPKYGKNFPTPFHHQIAGVWARSGNLQTTHRSSSRLDRSGKR